MRWSGLAACAAFLAGALPAAADTISSAPIFGGLSQSVAVCYVFNSSNTTGAVAVSQFFLFSDTGGGVSTKGNCPASLAAKGTCSAVFTIASNRAYSCEARLTNKAAARGSVEIRDSSARVLNRADMR